MDFSQYYTFFTVQYEVKNLDKLKLYLSEQDKKMRGDTILNLEDIF